MGSDVKGNGNVKNNRLLEDYQW